MMSIDSSRCQPFQACCSSVQIQTIKSREELLGRTSCSKGVSCLPGSLSSITSFPQYEIGRTKSLYTDTTNKNVRTLLTSPSPTRSYKPLSLSLARALSLREYSKTSAMQYKRTKFRTPKAPGSSTILHVRYIGTEINRSNSLGPPCQMNFEMFQLFSRLCTPASGFGKVVAGRNWRESGAVSKWKTRHRCRQSV